MGVGILIEPDSNGKDFYTYEELVKTLDESTEADIVMIISSCSSGGFAKAAKGLKKMTVFTACDSEETQGNYTNRWNGLLDTGISFMASDIINGLSSDHPMDTNDNRKITTEEFSNYLNTELKKEGNTAVDTIRRFIQCEL